MVIAVQNMVVVYNLELPFLRIFLETFYFLP